MRTDIAGWLRLQWDRAAAWGCLLAGVLTLFVGWLGVSETAYTAKQLPYIAGCGLGGLFLLGTAAMLWLSADLRDEWRKLDRIEAAIRESGNAGLTQVAGRALAVSPPAPAGDLTPGSRSPDRAAVANGRTP